METNISNSWDDNSGKPFTLTSQYNDNNYRDSVTWTVSNTSVTCNDDVTIEPR